MGQAVKPTLSHVISTERHTLDRFKQFHSWESAFDQVRRLFRLKRRLLYMVARNEIRKREFVETQLVSLEQIDELEELCHETVKAAKFVVMDMETQMQTSATDQTLIRAIFLVYMNERESFTELDVPELEF